MTLIKVRSVLLTAKVGGPCLVKEKHEGTRALLSPFVLR